MTWPKKRQWQRQGQIHLEKTFKDTSLRLVTFEWPTKQKTITQTKANNTRQHLQLRNSASSFHWLSSSIFTVCRSSFVPHRWHLLSSPLYDVLDHTNHIFYVRILSWQCVITIIWSYVLDHTNCFPRRAKLLRRRAGQREPKDRSHTAVPDETTSIISFNQINFTKYNKSWNRAIISLSYLDSVEKDNTG